jgi:hypothetical protein
MLGSAGNAAQPARWNIHHRFFTPLRKLHASYRKLRYAAAMPGMANDRKIRRKAEPAACRG